ncbi:MAG: transglutaminase-like domain-containing protein [Muribaculaceae bacterium]|nr:transglutaminase-like domain-containing protein [Muribaculaceae bacterium]
MCVLPLSLKKGKPAKVQFEHTFTAPEQFTDIILASPLYPTLKSTYRIEVPAELASVITLNPHNFPERTELKCEYLPSGDRLYTVSLDEEKKFVREKLGTSAAQYVPRIEVSGYFTDTEAIYEFLHSKVSDEERSESVAAFARELCAGLDNDVARIDTIASWVRNNIRYIAVEHGEYAYRPDAAEAVLTKRYGDCKGSANLIRTMLRSVGIDGRLVWIGTKGDVLGSWTLRPSLAAGNHMIAAAILPDTTIYIDGTIANAPAGLIPSSIAGRECLILNGDKCMIDTLPHLPPDSNTIEFSGQIAVAPSGLEGRYSAKYTGEMRMGLENYLQSLSAPKRKAALVALVSYGRKGVRPENVAISTPGENALYSLVEYDECDPSGVRELSAGKTYVLLRPFRAVNYPSLDVRDRSSDIDLGMKATFKTRLVCKLPDDMAIETIPAAKEIHSPWFEGFVEYTLSDDGTSLTCDALLRCIRSEGRADEVALWNQAVKEIEKISSAPIVLKKVLTNE